MDNATRYFIDIILEKFSAFLYWSEGEVMYVVLNKLLLLFSLKNNEEGKGIL